MEILLTVFVGIAAVALLIQCIAFVFLARAARRLSVQMEELSSRLVKLAEQLREKVEDLVGTVHATAEKLQALQQNLTATSEVIHRRAVSVDRFLSEATDSARLQVVRVQEAVELAFRRTEQAIDMLYRGVIRPVSEASAIINGLRAGLSVLIRRAQAPAVRRSHQDEEMFI
ncbi:MAG: hypothetical protein HXY20_11760 [Acidobacteria bacterium]|nr:hypothetical protein [Acidobacteriota bacterium]